MNEQVTHAGCRVSLATARGSLANQLVDTRCGVRTRVHLSRLVASSSSLQRDPYRYCEFISLFLFLVRAQFLSLFRSLRQPYRARAPFNSSGASRMHRGRRRSSLSETSARGDHTSGSPSAKNAGRARACYVSDHGGMGWGGEGADVTRRCSACPRRSDASSCASERARFRSNL